MKRKVKKYAGEEGSLVKGTTNLRTRSDDEMAEDSKFGGYGRYMPKTNSISIGSKSSSSTSKPSEDLAPSDTKSPWSGEDQSPRLRASKEEAEEAPTGIASGFKSGESKFERKDNEVKMPAVKKKVTPKVESKRASQSFPLKDEASGSQSFPLRGSSGAASSSALTRAGTESRTPDVMGTSRTRAGTVIPGREEPRKEDVDRAMASLNEKMKKQAFDLSPSKNPNRSYKSGGKVSTASSRGDGIAQRGKTKGRIC